MSENDTGGRERKEFPKFDEGDTVHLEGEEYTVVGVDPLENKINPENDVRAYYLESGETESIRIQPRYVQGEWQLIRVCSFEIDEIYVTDNDQ